MRFRIISLICIFLGAMLLVSCETSYPNNFELMREATDLTTNSQFTGYYQTISVSQDSTLQSRVNTTVNVSANRSSFTVSTTTMTRQGSGEYSTVNSTELVNTNPFMTTLIDSSYFVAGRGFRFADNEKTKVEFTGTLRNSVVSVMFPDLTIIQDCTAVRVSIIFSYSDPSILYNFDIFGDKPNGDDVAIMTVINY